MTDPIADRATVQTVTIDGKPIAHSHRYSPGEVASHRLQLEREARRDLERFAKDNRLTLPPSSVKVRWKLEIEGVGFPTPDTMRLEIAQFRRAAELELARGDRHTAKQFTEQADELEQAFESACERAYAEVKPIVWNAQTDTFGDDLADLAKLEERQIRGTVTGRMTSNRSAIEEVERT